MKSATPTYPPLGLTLIADVVSPTTGLVEPGPSTRIEQFGWQWRAESKFDERYFPTLERAVLWYAWSVMMERFCTDPPHCKRRYVREIKELFRALTYGECKEPTVIVDDDTCEEA